MTLYLLDTNIVSYFLKARHTHLINRLESETPQALCASVITEGELLFGLEKVGRPAKLTETIEVFLQVSTILPWDRNAARAYARLKTALQSQGIGMAPLDLMIAAHALSARATLITNDSALKRLTPWLPVEDWTETV